MAFENTNWKKFKTEIIDSGLYTRSGTEVGVSNGALKLVEKNGDYILEKTTDDDIPEICLSACSDLEIDYPKLNKFVFGKLPDNWLLGNYKKIYRGYITDETIRKNAASGGIMSGIQSYLLDQKKVDGAITLRMKKDKPYLAEPIIATSREEILSGAQSKYTISPINQILATLPGSYNSLVYTGLPEQIAAIRKLQMLGHASVKNIQYVLGVFYGETIGFGSIESLLRSHGVKNVEEIKSLEFRAGEWPGYLKIVLNNGQIIAIRKFHANYLIPSHITNYSLYQTDYMSELADISSGDGWAPSYEQRTGGWSVIIARSEKGLELLQAMQSLGKIYLEEISAEDLMTMHSHGIDFKKRGAFIRIAQRKKRGLPTPNYGYEPINIPKGRIRFEILLGFMFKFFQLPITIWVLEKIPPKIIGWFFIQARNIWKRKTKSTKNGNLRELKFKITN